jgi:tripartite-type tricarboxylate transporter receptor subunit TctC
MKVTKLQRATVVVAVLGVLSGWATLASAQSWPQRAVRFIIPFGPGAGADIGARLIQAALQTRWGKPVVIENRPGGDSVVAIQAFLSANDDHTFLWSPAGNFTVHPTLYKKLPYDPADIVPIARYSNTILAVGVPASMNIGTLKEFVERVRAAPGTFNGTAVPGITDFAFDYLAKTEGLKIAKVPYRDTVQAASDLGEARIQVYASSYAILRPQTEAGRIKVLAVMGRERAPSLPEIPSAAEAGYPALEMEGLVGLFGIKDMSDELREKIAADIIAVSRDPAVQAKLNASAQTPNPGGPKEFAESIARQRERIAIIAKAVGIPPKQ